MAPTVQEQVAAAMANAERPADIACCNCREMYMREEIGFPGEGDSCEECEPGYRMWDEIAADDAGVPRVGEF